jgi:hypothetical protein
VQASKIRIVSYGKSKPLVKGVDEASHFKNRRDEFIITKKIIIDKVNEVLMPMKRYIIFFLVAVLFCSLPLYSIRKDTKLILDELQKLAAVVKSL